MTGSNYCFAHNPETKDQHKRATVKGGKSSYKDGFLSLEPIDLTKPKNIILLIADTANRIRKVDKNGCMDIKTANCLAILSSKMIEAQKAFELEQENKELKEKIRKAEIKEDCEISDEELFGALKRAREGKRE